MGPGPWSHAGPPACRAQAGATTRGKSPRTDLEMPAVAGDAGGGGVVVGAGGKGGAGGVAESGAVAARGAVDGAVSEGAVERAGVRGAEGCQECKEREGRGVHCSGKGCGR